MLVADKLILHANHPIIVPTTTSRTQGCMNAFLFFKIVAGISPWNYSIILPVALKVPFDLH
jgi:hypothetical protein